MCFMLAPFFRSILSIFLSYIHFSSVIITINFFIKCWATFQWSLLFLIITVRYIIQYFQYNLYPVVVHLVVVQVESSCLMYYTLCFPVLSLVFVSTTFPHTLCLSYDFSNLVLRRFDFPELVFAEKERIGGIRTANPLVAE